MDDPEKDRGSTNYIPSNIYKGVFLFFDSINGATNQSRRNHGDDSR